MRGSRSLYKQNSQRILVILCILFVIAMLFFSNSTSPLYSSIGLGGDSAIFRLIGQGIRKGYTPYVDLFDHKGPILFFIEALGTFCGGYAIWIIQCFSGIITIYCFYLLWGMLRPSKMAPAICQSILFPILISFLVFFAFFQGGNLTEELCIPYTAICMLLFVKYYIMSDTQKAHPVKYAFTYGVFFAIIAYIRINNAVSICAIVIATGIFLILNREYKNALLNILFGLLGIIAVSIPVFLYFWKKGAVFEMLNATFLHNFKYIEHVDGNTTLHIFNSLHRGTLYEFAKSAYSSMIGIRFLPLLISALLLIIYRYQRKGSPISLLDWGIFTIIILNVINLVLSNSYLHYFTTSIPAFTFAMIIYGNVISSTQLKKLAVSLLLFIFMAYNIAGGYSRIHARNIEKIERDTIQADFNRIPANEKESVIGYNISAKYYLYGNVIPCEKYYTLQDWWSTSDPQIWIDFVDSINKDKPLWLLTTPQNQNEGILQIIKTSYGLTYEDDFLRMYRLQENGVTP